MQTEFVIKKDYDIVVVVGGIAGIAAFFAAPLSRLFIHRSYPLVRASL